MSLVPVAQEVEPTFISEAPLSRARDGGNFLRITDVKGIGPATAKKLSGAGVKNVKDLRHMEVEAVAASTGMSRASLVTWKVEANLMHGIEELKGVGPAVAKKLRKAGVKDLETMARASRERIAKAAGVAAQKAEELQKAAAKRLAEARKDAEKLRRDVATRGAKGVKKARKHVEATRKDLAKRGTKAGKEAAKVGKRATRNVRKAYRTSSKAASEAAHQLSARTRKAASTAAEAAQHAAEAPRIAMEDAGTQARGLWGRIRDRWSRR